MTFAKEEEIEVRGFRVKYEGADAWTAREVNRALVARVK
jgi:hypothetical protein